MAINEYKSDNPVTTASEPAVAYRENSTMIEVMQSPNMTVDEYFDEVEKTLDELEAKSTTPPPCQYTEEEAVQRVLQATAEAESGMGCLTLDEFEAIPLLDPMTEERNTLRYSLIPSMVKIYEYNKAHSQKDGYTHPVL